MLVTFNCPHCQAKIEADGELAGSRASCPNCERALTIPSPRLATGDMLAGFRIKQWLGSGAMGEVYLATQLSMDREVALKVLAASAIKSEEDVARFMHEVRMLAKLDHPNIVTAFEAGQHEGHYYLAMTFVNGETLDDKLRRQGPLPEKDVLSMGLKVAKALGYAWERNQLLHRDVKPSNIMIDQAGEVKLMDMGISKSLAEDHSMTKTGLVVGTPWYMSPEQAQGNEVGRHTDMYSLGATLYHLLTGHPPFDGPSTMAILTKMMTEPAKPPRDWRPEISPATDELLLHMLAKDPAERPETWPDLITAFQQALKGKPPVEARKSGRRKLANHHGASTMPAEVAPAPAPAPSSKLAVAAALLVVLALLGGAAFVVNKVMHQPSAVLAPPPTPLPAPGVTPTPPPTVTSTPPTVVPTPTPTPPAGAETPPPAGGEAIAVTPLDDSAELAARTLLIEARRRITRAPNDFDAALTELGRVLVMVEGTAAAAEIRQQMGDLERTRQQAYDESLARLERQAAPLLAKQQFAQAAQLYRDFGGPLAQLTATRRAELAESYEVQAQAQERQLAAQLEALHDSLAQAILRADQAGANRLLQDAAQSPLMTARPADLTALTAQVQAALRLPELLRESFRPEIGQEIPVQFVKTRETIQVQAIEGVEIRAVKLVTVGASVGKLGIRFRVEELAIGERLKRVERVGGEQVELYRGLLAVEMRRYDVAQSSFAKVAGGLGPALLRALEGLSTELRDAAAEVALRQLLRLARLPADGALEPMALAQAMLSQQYNAAQIRDLQAAVADFRRRFGTAKASKDLAVVLDELARLSVLSWPAPTKGLVFAWENQAKGWPNGKPITFNAYGRVQYGRYGEMQFGGGAYVAPDFDRPIVDACKQTNELTIGCVLTPTHLDQRGPARILSYSEGAHSRCFSLGQDGERLGFRLRTTMTGGNGSNPETALPQIVAGQRLHVMITYKPGVLKAYYNGELVVESDKVRGDFGPWTQMHLLFGNEWQGGRDWFGDLEGVSIYSRVLSPEEVLVNYQLYQQKLRMRK